MFTIQKAPPVAESGAARYSPVDEERGVAVVGLGSRGQLGGGVWVLVLNGELIPFETSEYLNDDPYEGVTIPYFTTFGSASYAIPKLGNVRYEFADEAERRAAQLLAIEGVLVRESWRGLLQSIALQTGVPFEELAKRRPPFKGSSFQFEGRVYTLDDFGYHDLEKETE